MRGVFGRGDAVAGEAPARAYPTRAQDRPDCGKMRVLRIREPSAMPLPAATSARPFRLSEAGDGVALRVTGLDAGAVDGQAARLAELGFLPGEPARVLRRGPFGGDPLAVRVGASTFALRRAEAAGVLVEAWAEDAP